MLHLVVTEWALILLLLVALLDQRHNCIQVKWPLSTTQGQSSHNVMIRIASVMIRSLLLSNAHCHHPGEVILASQPGIEFQVKLGRQSPMQGPATFKVSRFYYYIYVSGACAHLKPWWFASSLRPGLWSFTFIQCTNLVCSDSACQSKRPKLCVLWHSSQRCPGREIQSAHLWCQQSHGMEEM